jgi:uncharacterized protein YoaH (UPF0181 family)
MTSEVSHYLEDIKYKSRLSLADEREVISELETHIEDRLQELMASGLSEEEAIRTCLEQMGPTKSIAHQLYEAYSQGSWKQALLASIPHLLLGLLFALNWWHHVGWLSVVLLLILGTAVYGWWRGQPGWGFPWLGYSLLPVLAVGLLLIYLPRGWSLLAFLLYLPPALWWTGYIIVQSTRRDWLFSSLMLLPVPIVIGWFLAVSTGARFTASSLQRLYYFAPSIGLSFLALALTIAIFIRLRQRWLRIGLLNISGLLTLTLVVYYTSRLNTPTFLGLLLVMWGVFFIPPLLERRLKTGRLRFRHDKVAPT